MVKITQWLGSASGASSVLGSWQVCHSVCLALISVVSIFGITLTGMPLAFFNTFEVPFWVAAFFLFMVVLGMHYARRCMHVPLLWMNAGAVIAGFPFIPQHTTLFLVAGGLIGAWGLLVWMRE